MRHLPFLFAVVLVSVAYAAPEPPAALPALSAGADAMANLQKLSGKRATITTRSGKEYEGLIGEVTNKAVIVQALGGGKDFFSAWVRMDDIEAITWRSKAQ